VGLAGGEGNLSLISLSSSSSSELFTSTNSFLNKFWGAGEETSWDKGVSKDVGNEELKKGISFVEKGVSDSDLRIHRALTSPKTSLNSAFSDTPW
jgi:hypothetical protein